MLRFDERVHLPKNRENTITFLVNGEPIGTVETLAPGAKTVDIPIPTIDYDSVIDALGYIPYNSTNPNSYITSSALNGYATETWVGQQGYLTGINSSDITTALGYTPSDSTLSNVVAIDASSAVQTALDNKVSKSGDTMTGTLTIDKSSNTDYIYLDSTDIQRGVTPSANKYIMLKMRDTNDDLLAQYYYRLDTNGKPRAHMTCYNNDGSKQAIVMVGFDANDNAECSFPNTTCVDGQWVFKSSELANGVTWNSSSHSDAKDYSLSSYLPNDGQKYKVIIRTNGTTTSTSGKFIRIGIFSDIITTQAYTCACRTRTSSSQNCAGSIILPVGTGRKISVAGTTDASADGTYGIRVLGYRRIGTNS